MSRMQREKKTIRAMVRLYCRHHHQTSGGLCPDCQSLATYAEKRLNACPFLEDKTTCARCPVHCYNSAMQENVKKVMRFAGPRMIRHHPVLALRHFLDDRRKVPANPNKGGKP